VGLQAFFHQRRISLPRLYHPRLSQTFAAFENMDNPYAIAHELLDGPNDARPSAEQVIQDQGLAGKLDDRTVLITGGTAGLGKESARVMQKNGAKVYITARTAEKGEKVARELNRAVPNSQPIEVLVADLSNLQSVRDAAKDFLSRTQTLNVLLNNAGVMACPEDRTTDGFEMQFGVNHVAHFLLFQLLKDTLLASSIPGLESRVVALSSSGHRAGGIHFHNYNLAGEYDPWKAYGQSKTANILFANELDRRYGLRVSMGCPSTQASSWTRNYLATRSEHRTRRWTPC
jgi:NAD(P)-dependent dehydrogenase (short-subunit alcohol dehydrogenase family)